MLNQLKKDESVMIYDNLKEMKKDIPSNVSKIKSNILAPTHRLVKPIDFAIISIIIFLALAVMFVPSVFGYSQDEIDRNGIKKITANNLGQDTTRVTFDFCHNKYSMNSVGALVTSNLDSVPVPIDVGNIKYKQCVTYGTRILSDSNSIKVTLFKHVEIDSLVLSFNQKIHDLNNKLAQTQQKITSYDKLGKSTDALIKNANLLEKQIKSAQISLKMLIMMKNSQ
ncbi:MAG: hypothetical protein K5790_05825 [Nitrosopumilus sp.]|uniref:hypothetical protein n=1 Tax=Nitrosopumilus sp. TaxID=2024843 RepID=UPI00247D7F9E|nr:hypothetical protein [Nitrosopumilus sp.]MCV0392799.1 hypothetical protein [Nitrosopumilus sp.]